jgi:hypothetical protein
MWLEERVLLTGTLQNPVPLPLQTVPGPLAPSGAVVAGNLAQGGADFYQIVASNPGRLLAVTSGASSTFELRLSLFDSQGNLLVQSDSQSTLRLDPLIDQHVAAGTDVLEVQSLSSAGIYSLTTTLTPSSNPGQTVALPTSFGGLSYNGNSCAPLAVGQFTSDGILDLVAADGVHLGTGDGTFQAPSASAALVNPALDTPSAIVTFGDHNQNVAVAIANTDSVWIYQDYSNGAFQQLQTIGLPVTGIPTALVAGNFGNGRTDFAVAVSTGGSNDDVVILMNQPNGTYAASVVPVGLNPSSIAVGDFGNGHTDLAVADFSSGDVNVLANDGTANFTPLPPIVLPAGSNPSAIVAGDFGTGHTDLAVADANYGVVRILDGEGNDNFQFGPTIGVEVLPSAIVAGDFGNGETDLAIASENENEVSILLGNGNGTFQPAIVAPVGNAPVTLVAGDFNRDGRVDLATGNAGSNDISILLIKRDATFEGPAPSLVANGPAAMATGDFTGNGNLGLALVNQGSDSVTILPGNGDSTFQQPLTVPLPPGAEPTSIVAGDFNNDGRTDLAVTDTALNAVSILMGNGDGTFVSSTIPVPGGPHAIAVGDITGNGILDLAVACAGSSDVTILLGDGHGDFTPLPNPIPIGTPNNPGAPVAIVAGNFTSSGYTDLAVADQNTDDVTVLLGRDNGTFQVLDPVPLGGSSLAAPTSLVAGDFRTSGITDLAVASQDPFNGDTVDLLFNDGHGDFTVHQSIALASGTMPVAITTGHFYASPLLDLATADSNGSGTDDYSVFQNLGGGNFGPQVSAAVSAGGGSTALVAGDFTGNGRTDLAISKTSPDSVQVVLSNNNGTFSNPSAVDLVRSQTPVVGNLNGDGLPDVSVVDAAGNILYRAAQPGGSFAPPVTVNPGHPSRDIAVVLTNFGPLLASVDVNDNFVSLFSYLPSGFVLVGKLATGSLPAQIVAADLDGTGRTDLIVRNAGDGTLSVFYGEPNGGFSTPTVLPVGVGASDIEVANLHQDGRLDIVYSDRLAGEVGVIENLGGGAFAPPVLFHAGMGPYGVTGTAASSSVSSLEGTSSVAAGAFTPGDLDSIVALNPGSDTFGLLTDLGDGQLTNASIFPTGGNTLVVCTVILPNNMNGLAILTTDGLFIEPPDGHGGFLPPTEYNVGIEPDGLAVASLSGNGIPDLLVSNSMGDVEVLHGNTNGTFQAAQSLNEPAPPPVHPPGGSTPAPITPPDQRHDPRGVQAVDGGTTVPGNASTTLFPGGVDPVPPFAFSYTSGFEELVVGNAGDGELALFEDVSNGLTLLWSEFEPSVLSPTDLGFAVLTGRPVRFYAATAGRESAELVVLSLSIETSTTAPLGAAAAQNTVAQLVALHESSLPLVTTVLTLTISVAGTEVNVGLIETEATQVAAFLPGTASSVGQGLSAAGRSGPAGNGGAESDVLGESLTGAVPAVIAPWQRLVLGLDEAVEPFQRDNPNRVSAAPARDSEGDRPDAPPAGVVPAQGGPTNLKSGANPGQGGGERDATENTRRSAAGPEAVDAIIESVWGDAKMRTGTSEHRQLSVVSCQLSLESHTRQRARSSEQRTTDNEPRMADDGLFAPSLLVAMIATQWLHGRPWHRDGRPGWSGRTGDAVRRRGLVI